MYFTLLYDTFRAVKKISLELFDWIDTIRVQIHIQSTNVSCLCTVVYKYHTAIISELNLCGMLSPTYLLYINSIRAKF